MTQAQLVSVHREDRAAHITLDRPDAHNLVTHAMLEQLVDCSRAVTDADVVVATHLPRNVPRMVCVELLRWWEAKG